MNKNDPLKFGASEVCMKCEEPQHFYPADGKVRESKVMICDKCIKKIKALAVQMGKPQYWTKK